MSEKLKTIINGISELEIHNKNKQYICKNLVEALVQWGKLTHDLRNISSDITQEEFVENATRLSRLLSVLITQIGISDDYSPLPEVVLTMKQNKRFDLTEADSVTALVYCSHKVIECLAIIAAKDINL